MSPTLTSLTLYRGFPAEDRYTWSPFVNKLEARFRLDKLSYDKGVGGPNSAPRGKIPYIEFQASDDGPKEVLGDTMYIIDSFIKAGRLSDLNAKLSPEDKFHDMALRALLEEKLYFYGVHERWCENYYTMRDGAMAAIPYPVRVAVGLLAYRKIAAALYGQGTLRLTADEIHKLKSQTWSTIEAAFAASRDKVADAKKNSDEVIWALGGDEPTEVDATLFGFITSSRVCIAAPESQRLVKNCPTLMDYAKRIHNKYFPEYAAFD